MSLFDGDGFMPFIWATIVFSIAMVILLSFMGVNINWIPFINTNAPFLQGVIIIAIIVTFSSGVINAIK